MSDDVPNWWDGLADELQIDIESTEKKSGSV